MSDVRVPDLNTVTISGRLTRDPEKKHVGGSAVCRVSIANTRYYRTKSGERKQETLFVNANVWDKQAEWVCENLAKGSPVIIEGRLKPNEWTDKQTGQKRSVIEIAATRITPLEWSNENATQSSTGGAAANQSASPVEEPIPADDIPF